MGLCTFTLRQRSAIFSNLYTMKPRPQKNSNRALLIRPEWMPVSDYRPVSNRVQILRLHAQQPLRLALVSMRAQVVPRSTTTPTTDKELEKLYESFTRLWPKLSIPFYLRNSLLPDWKTMAGRYLERFSGECGKRGSLGDASVFNRFM